MKKEQQRIKIAQACGWERILTPLDEDWHLQDTETLSRLRGMPSAFRYVEGYREPLRDYLNDLNAMHEAEKMLFARNDWSGCDYETLLKDMTSSWCWHATAAQRAEAFLRTLNLWEETQ